MRLFGISGLSDGGIARAPGGFVHKDYPVRRLLQRAPRFFVLVDGFPMDDAIMRDPAFARD